MKTNMKIVLMTICLLTGLPLRARTRRVSLILLSMQSFLRPLHQMLVVQVWVM